MSYKICLILSICLLSALIHADPIFHKKPGLFGGLFGGSGHGDNYDGGHGGGSAAAASSAAASSNNHGGTAQSQSASFSIGDFTASIASSAANAGGSGSSGGKKFGGLFDDDYY